MAKCGCADGQCSCVIRGSGGITVTGSGTSSDPYVVSGGVDLAGLLQARDTQTVDMSIRGAGSTTDPYVISAVATVRVFDLVDVQDPAGPSAGDTLLWVTTGPTGHWEFAPASTAVPGAIVTATSGALQGDGSAGAPLAVRTSGTWGIPPLDAYGSDTLQGQPVYVDVEGNLRAAPVTPPETIPWENVEGAPSHFPSRWDLVEEKPTTFPTTWGDVTGRPRLARVTITVPSIGPGQYWSSPAALPAGYFDAAPACWVSVEGQPQFTAAWSSASASQVTVGVRNIGDGPAGCVLHVWAVQMTGQTW